MVLRQGLAYSLKLCFTNPIMAIRIAFQLLSSSASLFSCCFYSIFWQAILTTNMVIYCICESMKKVLNSPQTPFSWYYNITLDMKNCIIFIFPLNRYIKNKLILTIFSLFFLCYIRNNQSNEYFSVGDPWKEERIWSLAMY